MQPLNDLLGGLEVALQPENILFCFLGVLLGTVIGMLPGLNGAAGIAVMLPLVLVLDPIAALIMLAGLYYGAEYGSTISAVLLNTPGDGASLVTVMDGHPMARMGQAGKALAIAAISSFTAGLTTVIVLAFVAPIFAGFARNFGPPETFAIMVLGLIVVGGVVGNEPIKGILMAVLGTTIAMIGMDSQTSILRLTFGRAELFSGISLVILIVGVVALAELATQGAIKAREPIRSRWRDMILSKRDLHRAAPSIFRGGILGFVIGVLPGAGSTLASFFAYDVEKKVTKDNSNFGKGEIRGVAAPEAANNAAVNGAFVPTLTMGVPGSATTAILLGAFILFDIRPGPMLFDEQPDLVWGLIASFLIGNLMLLVLNLPLAPVFASILRIPYRYLYPVLFAIAIMAVYSTSGRLFDVVLTLCLAIFGIFMKNQNYPVAPMVLGLVLGGMIETELRRSVLLGDNSLMIFLDRPIAIGIFVLAIGIVITPVLIKLIRKSSRPKNNLLEEVR